MNKADIRAIVSATRALTRIKIETLTEARLYAYVANEQLAGKNHDLMTLSAVLEMPMSTLSRVGYGLVERGLFEYRGQVGDRRKKIVHAVIP